MDVVAVVGLGYVGLPLAIEFGKHFETIGFDVSVDRVEACIRRTDPNGEVTEDEFRLSAGFTATADPASIRRATFVVIAVPTPVDSAHQPDFGPLESASRTVGRFMQPGATVVFESTVYPGATEEVCIPILESESGLSWKRDFFVGYSPERINPGDRERTLRKIVKVVSGDTPETAARVAAVYEKIVAAGVHLTSSIAAAEAAKIIENTQRDLNIALINEFALILHRLGLDTTEVLSAAGTKWNFLSFKPGLVGGHCIGVDPYYLTHKAEQLGYHPQVILAGRRINDGMGRYVAQQSVKALIRAGFQVKGERALVLGLAFKENCGDVRNSRVADLVDELRSYGMVVHVHDPVASAGDAKREHGIELEDWDALPNAPLLVLAVGHEAFRSRPAEHWTNKLQPRGVFVDVKSLYDPEPMRRAGLTVWRL